MAATVPEWAALDTRATRVLAVDGETILLSVCGTADGEETAIWSAGTGFAAVQLQLLDAWLGEATSVG